VMGAKPRPVEQCHRLLRVYPRPDESANFARPATPV
jgi:hypothetical protein